MAFLPVPIPKNTVLDSPHGASLSVRHVLLLGKVHEVGHQTLNTLAFLVPWTLRLLKAGAFLTSWKTPALTIKPTTQTLARDPGLLTQAMCQMMISGGEYTVLTQRGPRAKHFIVVITKLTEVELSVVMAQDSPRARAPASVRRRNARKGPDK